MKVKEEILPPRRQVAKEGKNQKTYFRIIFSFCSFVVLGALGVLGGSFEEVFL